MGVFLHAYRLIMLFELTHHRLQIMSALRVLSRRICIHLLCFVIIVLFINCSADTIRSRQDAFVLLDKVKRERKAKVLEYLQSLHKQAKSVQTDEFMMRFFKLMTNHRLIKNAGQQVPEDIALAVQQYELESVFRHIENYSFFYDILLMDQDGEIFHSVLKQPMALNTAEFFKLSSISDRIKSKPTEAFVDFQQSDFLHGPSSFFMEPVRHNGQILGWYIFRVSISKLNNLLTSGELLGATGEVLLVNRSEYMLTDSRFSLESTILKKKIPSENVNYKFSKKEGFKTVVDYRGKRVLTAFEVFSFLGTEWLITAKIDEDEVLSQMYLNNEACKVCAVAALACDSVMLIKDSIVLPDKYVDVYMDEFKRIDKGGTLYTKSVHTCTALLIACPGRFAYLAHISPTDRAYGKNGTDLVNQIFRQIDDKELVKSEKRLLECYVISPTNEAVDAILTSLTQNGILLSQVRLSVNEKALFADVTYNLNRNKTMLYWKMNRRNPFFYCQNPRLDNKFGLRMLALWGE